MSACDSASPISQSASLAPDSRSSSARALCICARQRSAHGGRYFGVFYGNPDFAEFARLLGAHGERVERSEELVPALERAMESGKPAVVDVIQDRFEGLPGDLAPPRAG